MIRPVLDSLTLTAAAFLALCGCWGCRTDSISRGDAQAGLLSAPSFSPSPQAVAKGSVSGVQGISQPSTKASIGEFDLLSGVKDGLEKVGELLTFTEPTQQAPDPTSLNTKAKPSPRLYVAMARLSEEANQPEKAEEYYQKALQLDFQYLDALLGLGRLRDREGNLEEALKFYAKATKLHPDAAPAWNHLGLCYARMGRTSEAVSALEKAVTLAPREPRYRHNLATVLVQIGDLGSALRHLTSVHDEATACYNLGYLLVRKGDLSAALRYFNRALELRPNFTDAQAWRDALLARTQASRGHDPEPSALAGNSPGSTAVSPNGTKVPAPSSPGTSSGTGSAAAGSAGVAPLPPLDRTAPAPTNAGVETSAVKPLPPVTGAALR